MAYKLHIFENVYSHIRLSGDLSREGRIRLFTSLHHDLAEHADAYRNDPARRLAAGSSCFRYHCIIRDKSGDGRTYRYSFVVSDQPAEFGVLQVVFVDSQVI